MIFTGTIQEVKFNQNEFYILSVALDPHEEKSFGVKTLATVKGNIPFLNVKKGTWFGFEGEWINHETFGKQIQISKAPILGSWKDSNVIRALTAQGIDPFLLGDIFLQTKEEFQRTLEDVDKLIALDIDANVAEEISNAWKDLKYLHMLFDFISQFDFPSYVYSRVLSYASSLDKGELMSNPWTIIDACDLDFKSVDQVIVKALNFDLLSPKRISSAISYVFKELQFSGHVYFLSGNLYDSVRNLIGDVPQELFVSCLVNMHKKEIFIERFKDQKFYYPIENYNNEVYSASALRNKLNYPGAMPLDAAKTYLDNWSEFQKISLSDKQKEGVLNALTYPVSVLTGYPGTGKTQSVKAIVSILAENCIDFLLCAPTGIAAKRLATVTGYEATTIHSALMATSGDLSDMDGSSEGSYIGLDTTLDKNNVNWDWGYTEDNPHPASVIIVDESSMLDLAVLTSILKATREDASIVFVGDAAQLPSVGAGNVLKDLIVSDKFPTVRLTEIFRQKETSGIVYASHSIVKGDYPSFSNEFSLIEMDDDFVPDKVIEIAKDLYDGRQNFQVLSPRHGGPCGVTKFNDLLRSHLNPKRPGLREVLINGASIREDDRIMITRNNKKLKIFNGEVGKIFKIDHKSKTLGIKIHDDPPRFVEISFKLASKHLRLAYACTVHKAQGLEYDIIVIPVLESFGLQLQRNLYYTAVTRAKQKVYMIGSGAALAKAINNTKQEQRNSLLSQRI